MRLIQKLKRLFSNKYLEPIKKLLLQGTSPKMLAIGIAGAVVIGLFPVIGSTTLLCTIFALSFRLNLPLIQLVNYSIFPLQLMLIIPLMKLGEIIFGFEKLKYGITEIIAMINNDTLHAIAVLWNVTMQAIGAWLLFAPLFAFLVYLVMHPILKKIKYYR
jgi:uncharacterized protein (DUF2062 family)